MLNTIKHLIEYYLSIYGWWILFALGTVLSFSYLAGRRKQINSVESSLLKVKGLLGDRLGSKGSLIFDIWLDGLNAIKDGDFTDQEMLDEFMKIIKMKASSVTPLNKEEEAVVEEAAQMTISSLNGQKNKIAVQILSKK